MLFPFGDIPKNGTGIGGGNSNNQANNFFRLQNYIEAHPTFGSLGTPILEGAERVSSPLDDPVDLTGFCYAVVHYGVGRGGIPGTGGEASRSSRLRTIQTYFHRAAPDQMGSAGSPVSISSTARPTVFRMGARL
jgi:hypothetical protein